VTRCGRRSAATRSKIEVSRASSSSRPTSGARSRALPGSADPIGSPMSSLTSTSTALPRIPTEPTFRYRNVGAAEIVRGPTRICPGSASCWMRAATLTASPVTMTSPRRGLVVDTTSPLLMPMRTSSSGLPSDCSRLFSSARRFRIPSAARIARAGSSSCATGTPKTAMTASPMNFSTVPPRASISSRASSK
jgi:hypothetical protein